MIRNFYWVNFMSVHFQLHIYYTWIFQVKNICVAFVSWIKRYLENLKHSANCWTVHNVEWKCQWSTVHNTGNLKGHVSNGTSNRVFGEGRFSVYSGMGGSFLLGGELEWKNAELPSRFKQEAICSAYYMKKTTLSRTYFKNILF